MDKFNSKHIIFLICGTTIVSLKTYPTIYMKSGGRDSWVAMIISSILIFLFFMYILKICVKNNCFNLYEIYCKALGKLFGNIFIGLFLLTLFITLIEGSSLEASSMHTNMLLLTPPWFILLLFVFPALYTVKKGKVAIMLITMIGITLIMVAGINLSILTAKYKKFKYLFPIFQNGLTFGFLASIAKSLGLYGSIAIVLPYLNEIKEKAKLKKHTIIGLIIVIQMEIIAATGVIMTFNIDRTNLISYPKLIQTQLVSYFGFLENGELYVMLQIVGGWFLKYILTFFSIILLLKQMKITNKYIHYIITALVFGISYYTSKNLFRLFRLLNYYTYFALINFIIIPLIIITIFSIREGSKKKVNKNIILPKPQ